jgi:hypothetical protein
MAFGGSDPSPPSLPRITAIRQKYPVSGENGRGMVERKKNAISHPRGVLGFFIKTGNTYGGGSTPRKPWFVLDETSRNVGFPLGAPSAMRDCLRIRDWRMDASPRGAITPDRLIIRISQSFLEKYLVFDMSSQTNNHSHRLNQNQNSVTTSDGFVVSYLFDKTKQFFCVLELLIIHPCWGRIETNQATWCPQKNHVQSPLLLLLSQHMFHILFHPRHKKNLESVYTLFFLPPLSHSGIPSCSNVATTWTNRVAQTNHDPRQPAITGSLGRRPRPLRPPSSPPPLSRFADPLPCRRTRSRPKPHQTNDWSITILGLLDRVNSSSRGLRRPGSCVPLY